ncbi:MAG: hypothetical protein ACOY3P_10525 [Planctomycetota bacterium]
MLEVFQTAVALPTLPYTILLVLVLLYWLLFLVGAAGADLLDGVDLDVDADVDVDADADAELASGSAGWLAPLLQFFFVGEVPLTVIFSILIIAMWTMAMIVNYYLGGTRLWVGLALFPALFFVGLVFTRAVLTPIAPYLKRVLAQEGDKIDLVGKRCTIHSIEATSAYGQAEVPMRGAPLLLNVRTNEGIVLKRGEEAVICRYDETARAYVVTGFDGNAAG